MRRLKDTLLFLILLFFTACTANTFTGVADPESPVPPLETLTPSLYPATAPVPDVKPTSQPFTYFGEVAAPDIPTGLEWLNVAKPISLAQDLRGKIVILDFWTLGCINCLHIMPDLALLEEEFPDSLVVIGIHSAKFTAEGESESIRQAIIRYNLHHPVVNDAGFQVWNTYGARAWPTVFLIDPFGKIVGYHAGENIHDILQPVIKTMDREYRAAGAIDTRPLELVLESRASVPTILSFPGKLIADETGNRLFIADSNHNRIVVTTLDGEILYAIGSGAAGRANGDFTSATFNRPQGMALSPDGNLLYIADLENHLIRAANLSLETVSTIAGTGYQGRALPTGRPGRETALSSPWDLLLDGDRLYIAIAGLHQIWVHDLKNDRITLFAGSGQEGMDDGPPLQASLAQPSGFATDGTTLFFADSESSAIRQMALDGLGRLTTIIGQGLFDFGDVDGAAPDARLQHALGIAWVDGVLYVADTYNHKIKRVDPISGYSETWIGTGAVGWQDGAGTQARLAEPSGLAVAFDKLYIADTNNHLIRIADLPSGEISTLVLTNLSAALPPAAAAIPPLAASLGVQTIGPGEGILEIIFTVPAGYKFNELGPFTLSWEADSPAVQFSGEGEAAYKLVGPSFPIEFPISTFEGEATLFINATVFFCEAQNGALCLIQDIALEIPIIISAGSIGSDIQIVYELPGITP